MKVLFATVFASAALQLFAAETTVRPELAFSKTFGGRGSDYGTAVAADGAGNVYVVGTTTSLDFPVKNGVQPRIGGSNLRSSTDGGKTWTSPAIPEAGYAVAGSPKAPGVLYAGTANTIYKSTDGGKNWVSSAPAPTGTVSALMVDPVNAAVVYAATATGILKSQDAGASWKTVGLAGQYVIVLAMHPSRPGTLLAGVATNGTAAGPALYRSTDAGANWTLLGASPPGIFALASDPANPDVFYVAASPQGFSSAALNVAIFKTVNGGTSWSKVKDAPVAISTFALAASPTAVFAGTNDGVIRSRDGGVTWSPVNLSGRVGNLVVDPDKPDAVYAATTSIYASADGGTSWIQVLPVRQIVETIAVTPGGLFVGASPGQNIFVTKWSADGKQMLYSTYLGGSYYDFATAVAVDRQGNAYVTGYTYSTDFPVTRGAVQSKTEAVYAAFAAKIGADGGTLVYSTYLGGSTGDAAFGIALDGSGNAYLTGYAGSVDFPVTAGGYQTRIPRYCAATAEWADGPTGDAFAVKLNAEGSGLVYSALLGGSCEDQGNGIAVDSAGNAFVVGITNSEDFPTTKGALRQTSEIIPIFVTGFLAQLTPQGNAVTMATFIGGDFGNTAAAAALDAKNNIYVTGCTNGFDNKIPNGSFALIRAYTGPTLPQAGISEVCVGAAYVLKLNPAGSTQTWLKYVGSYWSGGNSIAVDRAGQAWIAGYSAPIDNRQAAPAVHPFQAKMGQGFVSEISADGSEFLFSSRGDYQYHVALDDSGNAFLASFVGSTKPDVTVTRIEGAAPSAVTAEEPQRLGGDATREDRGVAPGEIVVVKGSGMGPAEAVGAQIGANGRLATSLAGTRVMFDGSPAPIISAQAERVVCIVPFGVGGTTTMQVQSGGAVSNSIRLPVTGTMIEILALVNEDGTVNSAGRPAKAGSVVTVYGAGFGRTNPAIADGEVNANGAGSSGLGLVRVSIGGQSASVLFAGAAPGQVAGVVQINVRVPQVGAGRYEMSVGVSGDADVVTLTVGK